MINLTDSEGGAPRDEIAEIIASYENPAPAPLTNEDVFTPGRTATPAAPLPFISHDATQNPKQEYYQRGAKKGQPKPPKKGQAPTLNPAGQLSVQATTFITGGIFIVMIDLVLPLLIAGTYNYVQSRKKGEDFPRIDYEKMKMSKSQRDDLGMVADAVVRELKVSGSPSLLFFMGLAGIYFMNFIMQKSAAEMSYKKAKQNEKDNQRPFDDPNRPFNNTGYPN